MINSQDQYESAKELFNLLRMLAIRGTEKAENDLLYTYGDVYRTCGDCGYTIEECGGHDDRDWDDYDDSYRESEHDDNGTSQTDASENTGIDGSSSTPSKA